MGLGGRMTATQLRLTCAMTAAGNVLVTLAGELDVASARYAFDSVRMSDYASAAGCPLTVSSPGPHLLKIMRITGLDHCLAIDLPQLAVQH